MNLVSSKEDENLALSGGDMREVNFVALGTDQEDENISSKWVRDVNYIPLLRPEYVYPHHRIQGVAIRCQESTAVPVHLKENMFDTGATETKVSRIELASLKRKRLKIQPHGQNVHIQGNHVPCPISKSTAASPVHHPVSPIAPPISPVRMKSRQEKVPVLSRMRTGQK
jgi:hypothetical protein